MRQIETFADDRDTAWCLYCAEPPSTREHVPSKVLLDDPFPANLPIVGACSKCNQSYSLDEEYLACLLECVLSGGTDPSNFKRSKIRRILERNKPLAARLAKAHRLVEGQAAFEIEYDRVENVVTKLAKGHVLYENSILIDETPTHCVIVPLPLLDHQQLNAFETIPNGNLWPEVGSRAFIRLLEFNEAGWTIVQPGMYRYLLHIGPPLVVRIVIQEYIAAEVRWED